MPKRKKTIGKKKVGAVKTGAMQQLLSVAAGALASRFLAGKVLSKMDPKLSAGVQVGAGLFLSMQRNPMIKGIGLGMFAGGAVFAGQSFGLLAGVPSKSSYLQKYPADEMPVISGPGNGLNYLGNPQQSPELSVISGIGNPQGDPAMSVIS